MIHDVKPYPAYKDSGVPWLGKVPEHWEVRSLGSLTSAISDRGRADLPLLSVVREKGVIPRSTMSDEENHNFVPEDLSNYKVVREGNLVINKMKAWQGSLGIAPIDGVVSPAYYVFDFQIGDRQFGQALLRSKTYVGFFAKVSDGVRIGQWDLSIDGMKRIPVVVPPLPEQLAIVRFLDYVDRRIQRYIRAKRKLIGLLNEMKQAIIQRAVTRGLAPNVPLKPSGVEWLGDIPEHWELRKLRYCGVFAGGMTPSMAERSFWEGSIPWVTPKDMKRSEISDSQERVTDSALRQTTLRIIPAGAVLLVVRGMILARRVPIARTTAPVTLNQDMKAVIPWPWIDPGFLGYTMESAQEAFAPLIDEAGHGTRRLPTERWRELVFAFPSIGEQTSIVRFLHGATEGIDRAIAIARRESDLLCKYRARLISDVVTGKLDVRETAASVPEEPGELEAPDEEQAREEGDEGSREETEVVPEEAEA